MTAKPTVAVVIPVRNGMPYIEEALESVLAATGVDEVVVRENGSTDGTAEWLRERAERGDFRLLVADHPGSAAENWTAVVEAATTDYVKLLCADDYLLPGGIERQIAAATATPDAVLIASRRRVVDESDRTVVASHGIGGVAGHHDGADVARRAALGGRNPFGEPSAVLFRRDALVASLPFDDTHPYVIDLDMYVRVLARGAFVGLRTVDAAFRVSTTSWSAAIGSNQARQFDDWVAHLVATGRLVAAPATLAIARVRIRAVFFARRIVTRLAALRA
jgi:glycosyltransferase involved in cell wall biosynthesis